ncbi:MAG: 16S rRNA (guanine(966)-N(2))-methyltransferase RsmD [Nitrospiraceae bacterium]
MRVIAGVLKGRRLLGPPGQILRPTSDRVKEALFSIIGVRIEKARVLDLYAGTGAIGIEAVSRGAQFVTFVENSPGAVKLLRENLRRCGIARHIEVYACPVEQFVQRQEGPDLPYQIVFADPPYAEEEELQSLNRLFEKDRTTIDSFAVLEHATKLVVPEHLGLLKVARQYRYGDTSLSVFRADKNTVHAQ